MRTVLSAAIAATVLVMTGCNKPESPDQVAKDVSNAEQKASTEVARSQDSAAKDLGSAADKVDDKLVAFNNDAARGGDAQKACKDQADADYNAAVANAKAVAQSQKQ